MDTETLAAVAYPAICPLCRREPSAAVHDPCPVCAAALAPIPPPHCRDCGGTVDGALDVCSECLATPRPWDAAVAAFYFAGLSRTLVHRFKYSGDVALGPMAAHALAAAVRDHDFAIDAIVPVPLHWLRRLRRGYNQSELVAQQLAEHLQIPVQPLLRRCRRTKPQASLTLSQRRRNLASAFACRQTDLTGRRLLLVDDVLTTGSTLAACTQRLRRAGAAEIVVATIARG